MFSLSSLCTVNFTSSIAYVFVTSCNINTNKNTFLNIRKRPYSIKRFTGKERRTERRPLSVSKCRTSTIRLLDVPAAQIFVFAVGRLVHVLPKTINIRL